MSDVNLDAITAERDALKAELERLKAQTDTPEAETQEEAQEVEEMTEMTQRNYGVFRRFTGSIQTFFSFLSPTQNAIIRFALAFTLLPLKVLAVIPFNSVYLFVRRLVAPQTKTQIAPELKPKQKTE